MKSELVVLAALMALATYPSRALPLLVVNLDRLPRRVLDYLRLVGPAVLAALAAVNVAISLDATRHPSLHVGVEWLAVAACAGLTIWRRSLLLGLVVAVGVVAVLRATGVAPLP